MKFGRIHIDDAEGAILAHSVDAGALKLRKAHRISREDVLLLADAGIGEVSAAVLEPGDLDENEAAAHLASALVGPGVEARQAATGRVNLHARTAGIFSVDAGAVHAVNAVDPEITLATLADHVTVDPGTMVATVKIIPFGVAAAKVDAAVKALRGAAVLRVHAFSARRVALVQTVLPSTKPTVLDKTTKVTEQRLRRSGSTIAVENRVNHDAGELSVTLRRLERSADIIIIFGASAVSDDDDVVPAAIRLAGGTVERVGMPVDPGNLLVLGTLSGKQVIGAPGCARSQKTNGFDWVIDRLFAGLAVDADSIGRMGVGGLLTEIAARPQPREPRVARDLAVAGVLLAAGRSSRMGGANKLLAEFDGEPLVRLSAKRLAESSARPVVAVLGHQAEEVRDAIGDVAIGCIDNPDFASGLASSLKAGIRALGSSTEGVLVMLADMPGVTATDLDRMIATFRRHGGQAVVRATAGGQRGNPVILPAALVARVDELEGDTGARHLIETGGLEIVDVELGEAARLDVDTPEALAAAGGKVVS